MWGWMLRYWKTMKFRITGRLSQSAFGERSGGGMFSRMLNFKSVQNMRSAILKKGLMVGGSILLFVYLARFVPRYIANMGIKRREKAIQSSKTELDSEKEELEVEIMQLKDKLGLNK